MFTFYHYIVRCSTIPFIRYISMLRFLYIVPIPFDDAHRASLLRCNSVTVVHLGDATTSLVIEYIPVVLFYRWPFWVHHVLFILGTFGYLHYLPTHYLFCKFYHSDTTHLRAFIRVRYHTTYHHSFYIRYAVMLIGVPFCCWCIVHLRVPFIPFCPVFTLRSTWRCIYLFYHIVVVPHCSSPPIPPTIHHSCITIRYRCPLMIRVVHSFYILHSDGAIRFVTIPVCWWWPVDTFPFLLPIRWCSTNFIPDTIPILFLISVHFVRPFDDDLFHILPLTVRIVVHSFHSTVRLTSFIDFITPFDAFAFPTCCSYTIRSLSSLTRHLFVDHHYLPDTVMFCILPLPPTFVRRCSLFWW